MNNKILDRYVVLPSNVNIEAFPHNTQSNFTTLLPKPIVLEGNYEVALTEITYSPLVLSNIGQIEFAPPKVDEPFQSMRSEVITHNINIINGLSSSKFAEELNKIVQDNSRLYEYTFRMKLGYDVNYSMAKAFNSYYNHKHKDVFLYGLKKGNTYEFIDLISFSPFIQTFRELGAQIYNFKFILNDITELSKRYQVKIITVPENENETFKSFKSKGPEYQKSLKDEIDAIVKDKLPVFSILDDIKLQITYPGKIKFLGIISQILTGNNETEFNGLLQSKGRYTIKSRLNVLNYAAIYIDCIEEQYLGTQLTQLLRCITLNSDSEKDVVAYFDNPIYLPVNKTEITGINIQLHDLKGDQIKFVDKFAFVILTLHFRPRKN